VDKQKLAELIIKEVGGKENIQQSWHCITRLRFNVVNNEKVNLDKIKSLDGVLGAQFKSGQFQVIIGKDVIDVFKEISQFLGKEPLNQNTPAPKQKLNIIERIFDTISGIFTPILPAIVGAGLLKGVLALFVALKILSETNSSYQILYFISDAPFNFLPFLIAFTAAKKFNTDPSLSVTLAGVLMYPKIMEYAAGGTIHSLKFLGISIPMNNYASSVIPIILGIWLLSYVHKGVEKITPKSLRIVFVPLLALLITAPLLLMFIAPIGNYAGIYLEMLFSGLFSFAGPIAGLLMGGLMPLIVITGMHYAFFPSTFASFEKYGFDIMLLPMNFVANFAQAGATLGVYFKTKDKKMKQLSLSTFIPAIFGITEPAIYGVTMKLKKPFYASLVGGAVGGAIFGTFAVKATAFTIPGIMSLPTYIIDGTNNFLFAVIGVAASLIVSLTLTLLMNLKEETSENMIGESEPVIIKNIDNTSIDSMPNDNTPIDLYAPLTGEIIPLQEVPDSTFSNGLVGKGIAIVPKDGVVYSPFSGKVTMVTPTNHAIGITSNNGVELLIHIGLDTVALNGEGFILNVQIGEEIEYGDKLLTFDIEKIKQKNISLISPIIVTNSPQFLDIICTLDNQVNACKSKLLMLIR